MVLDGLLADGELVGDVAVAIDGVIGANPNAAVIEASD
jgi:hypothetical protein